MAYIITFVTFIAVSAYFAHAAGPITLTQAQKDEIVAVHNDARKAEGATAMQRLKWNQNLADFAAKLAAKCTFDHGPDDDYKNAAGFTAVGENYFGGGGSSWTIKDAMELWMGEKSSYTGSPDDIYSAGHYTQAVWADTTDIGCAYYVCNPGDPGLGGGETLEIYCDYGPSGNVQGELPFAAGDPGSECASKYPGEKADADKLCVK